MTQTNNQHDDNLLTELNRHVLLVMLHVSWPKLSFQIADAVVEIKGDDDETKEIDAEFRSNPQWQLMPPLWRKKFATIEGRARNLLASASVKFAAKGIAAVPTARAARIFANLRELRTELEQDRDDFIAEYSQVLENLRERLGEELFKKAASKLPDEQAIRAKFGMVWAIVPVGGNSDIRDDEFDTLQSFVDGWRARMADGLDVSEYVVAPIDEELDRVQSVLTSLRNRATSVPQQLTEGEAEDLLGEARQQMNQFTQQMLQDMAREPRQLLLDAADNLLEALHDPERIIRSGTIAQVQRAFEMVEGFSFIADSELLTRMRDCNSRLNSITPQQLNSDAEIGARLAAGLQNVREQAADAGATAASVRNFRRINIGRRAPASEEPVTA